MMHYLTTCYNPPFEKKLRMLNYRKRSAQHSPRLRRSSLLWGTIWRVNMSKPTSMNTPKKSWRRSNLVLGFPKNKFETTINCFKR